MDRVTGERAGRNKDSRTFCQDVARCHVKRELDGYDKKSSGNAWFAPHILHTQFKYHSISFRWKWGGWFWPDSPESLQKYGYVDIVHVTCCKIPALSAVKAFSRPSKDTKTRWPKFHEIWYEEAVRKQLRSLLESKTRCIVSQSYCSLTRLTTLNCLSRRSENSCTIWWVLMLFACNIRFGFNNLVVMLP